MKRTFWKNALAFALSAALAVSTCVGVAAEGEEETQAPNVLNTEGTTIPVNPENIQDYLDGKYGSIDGATLVLSEGNYGKLELGRATKYEGSKTDYYIGGIAAENVKTYDEFVAIKNSSTWSASAYYVRNMSNVTIKAAEGATVTVAGMIGSSGHVYGNCYDYVLDKAYTSGSAYYLTQNWSNITFEGIQFTSKVNIESSLETTVIDGVTFRGCSFTTNGTASSNGQGLRYYNENDTGNVKNLTVENCTFNNCYQGVYTQKINGVTVKNSSFDTTGHNAIAVQSGGVVNHKAVVITGNTFANIGDRIIRFGDVGADTEITIQNNTATNSGDGAGEVIKAQSLAEGVKYHISDNRWGEGKMVANPQFHDLVHHAETDSTCVKAGNTEYWECPALKKLYIDEQRTVETTIEEVTKDLAPHTLTTVKAKDATCTEKGYTGDVVCAVCGKTMTVGQEIAIDPNNHDLKLVKAVDATTAATGVREHYECTRCDNWFWDGAGNYLIENHNAIVTAKLTSQTENVKSDVVEPDKQQTVTGKTESGAEVQLKVEIDTETLKENTVDTVVAVDNTSDDLKEKAVNVLKKDGEDVSTDDVDVVLTPAVEIKNVQVNETNATITMNISLVCKAEARVNGKVVLEETTEVPNEKITKSTVITISVPASWNNETIIVRHATKDRGIKFYSAVAANGTVTFTVPKEDGFSPFTLYIDDGATVTVKLDGETKTYNRMDVVNETALPTLSKNNYLFKGWKFEGIENQHFNMTAWLFEELLDKNAVVVGSSVFEGPLSEHPEIEEAKKNGTWGVDENKPAATAKPAAAAAVTPVRSSIPKTSDDSNLLLWVCLMGLASLGLGGALYLKKRSNK